MPAFNEKPQPQVQELKEKLKHAVNHLPEHSVAYAKSLFPIAGWLPRYNVQWMMGDLIAGITVALVIFPQAISYATKLANLPAQFGLYTGFIGCLIYAVFATSKDVTIGATAVLSLVVGQSITTYIPKATTAEAITFALTLSFWAGLIQVFIGLFRLGVVVDFVPIPVIVGFTSGAGIQIVIQQLPGLLGIKGINTNNAPYQIVGDLFKNILSTAKWDAIFGITALFFILFIKFTFAHLARKTPVLRFVGFLRNAIVLITYTGVSYALRDRKDIPLNIVKSIPYGLSGIQGPNVSTSYLPIVAPALPSIFVVSLMEHIAVVKTYGRVNGYTVNPNQEIVAIGMTNFIGSFVGAIPSTGSFSRSAIKSASGVRTPMATFYTGILVIIGLFTITDVLYWIPNAVLSAIVIAAIGELINFSIVKSLFEIEILDFLGFWIALIIVFVSNIENALYAAVGYSVLVLLIRIARPNVSVLARTNAGHWIDPEHEGYKKEISLAPEGILVFKIDESLTYPNSGFFMDKLKEIVLEKFKYSARNVAAADKIWSDDTEDRVRKRERQGLVALPSLRAVVLDFSAVNNIDYTGLQALLDSRDDLSRFSGRSVPFHFVHVRRRQLNTLLRVPAIASGASVDATPGNPAQDGKTGSAIRSLLNRFKPQNSSSTLASDQDMDKALDYFHFTVDDAVEAADLETRQSVEEEQIVISSSTVAASDYIVSTNS
ncbi:UNVERIFIED_CONTAM: hypothetical protein HDU68_008277 [Siphonaria sp. JEL0065]|nr:hypothetical protein HDU68_008277 [Siphonaria sp. JEL0065]